MAVPAAQLTRQQIMEVMHACGIEECDEDAINDCVAKAMSLRDSKPTTAQEHTQQSRPSQKQAAAAAAEHHATRDSENQPPPAAQQRSVTPGAPAAAAGQPRKKPAGDRQLYDPDFTLADERERRAATRTPQSHPQAFFRYSVEEVAAPQPRQQQRAAGRQPQPAPRHRDPAAGNREHETPSPEMYDALGHQLRVDKLSNMSVRGTPVAGQQQRGLGAGRNNTRGVGSLGVRSASPIGFSDFGPPPSGGFGQTKRTMATMDSIPAMETGALSGEAANFIPSSSHQHRPARARIPGYMSTVYADHLRQRVDAAYSEDTSTTGPHGAAPLGDDEGLYPHQRRFKPFVDTARARSATSGTIVQQPANEPTTARGTWTGGGVGDQPDTGRPRTSGGRQPSRQDPDSQSAAASETHHALEQTLMGVIYAPLGSKTYLSGCFRSRSAKAPVANPRLGAPRRSTDPVSRYHQMKQYWDRDGFLRSQKPEGQRRKLRWAVRQSMTEWQPDYDPPVQQHSYAAYV
jgi:hypothetical protein